MENQGRADAFDPRLHVLLATVLGEIKKIARSLRPSDARAMIIGLSTNAESAVSVMALPPGKRGIKLGLLNTSVDGLKRSLGVPANRELGLNGSLTGLRSASCPSHAILAQTSGSVSIVTVIKETSKHYTCHYLKNEKQPFKVHKSSSERKLFFGDVQEAIDWLDTQHELNRAAIDRESPRGFIQEGSREWQRRERQLLAEHAPKIKNCCHCGSPQIVTSRCQFCNGLSSTDIADA